VEILVPKDATLVKVIFVEGFTQHEFNIPPPEISPTPGPTASPAPSATSSGGTKWSECLPLIPFALTGGVAAVGIVINRSGIRKR
jgi:hypothetical protein